MKKFLIAAPLALAAVAAVATPASAASWYDAGQLRAEIAQLDRQVDRMRGLSPREERRLENQVDRLQAMYRDYARGGFNRAELQRLNGQVSALKSRSLPSRTTATAASTATAAMTATTITAATAVADTCNGPRFDTLSGWGRRD